MVALGTLLALSQLWHLAGERVSLPFIPEASPTLAPALTPGLICGWPAVPVPLQARGSATSLRAQGPTGQLKDRTFGMEVWVASMLLTLGPASACRAVYYPRFKDQCPVLMSALECGGHSGTAL